jgi:8-oxo-dGTP pyrophosphatase MutT (NUDIX family)
MVSILPRCPFATSRIIQNSGFAPSKIHIAAAVQQLALHRQYSTPSIMSAKVVKASMSQKAKGPPMEPKPSSSVLLISPTNQVLLLHRVKTSSAFPSAHVFPGGNVDTKHDGVPPDPKDPSRHLDSKVYRMAAIRETFEESGILLAKKKGSNTLLSLPDAEREQARKDIHSGKKTFPDWLSSQGGEADTG